MKKGRHRSCRSESMATFCVAVSKRDRNENDYCGLLSGAQPVAGRVVHFLPKFTNLACPSK